MAPAEQSEETVRLDPRPDFDLPDLDRTAGLRTGLAREELVTLTYWDTDDRRLARRALVALCETSGDMCEWTVTAPEGAYRYESTSVDTVDPEVSGLLTAVVRDRELRTVARLERRRLTETLHEGSGRAVAQIELDELTVPNNGGVTERSRELVARFDPSVEADVRDALVARLTAAGAVASERAPAHVRLLAVQDGSEPELVAGPVGKKATIADLVTSALVDSVERVITGDRVAREGRDAEGVHQMRVGLRRIRSVLHIYAGAVDKDWAEALRADISPVMRALGAVRDVDVMRARMVATLAALDDSDRALGGEHDLLARLDSDYQRHRARLLGVLGGDYVAFVDRLVAAAAAPKFTASAARIAADFAPSRVKKRWRELDEQVDALGDHPSDDALHELRIATKRVRYAVEAIVPAVRDAEPLAERLASLQDCLGDLHDSAVAAQWLRSQVASAAGPEGYLLGLLVAREAEHRRQLRAQWPDLWNKADKKKLRSWM